jgi:integrase
MASKYLRGEGLSSMWWVKFTHPRSGERLRMSLQTRDPARAELLRRRLECELALLKLPVASIKLPETLALALHGKRDVSPSSVAEPAPPVPVPEIVVPLSTPVFPPMPAMRSIPIEEALHLYLVFIRSQNDRHHVKGRISQLRAFFGTHLVDPLVERLAVEAGERIHKRPGMMQPGYFTGSMVQEITVAMVIEFLEKRRKANEPLSAVTKSHYREMFHQFFEVLLGAGVLPVTNFHTPNPMSALPTFSDDHERVITFLTEQQIAKQLEVLRGHPSLEAAVMLMVHAGLRRNEALWRRIEDVGNDFKTLSIRNVHDEKNATKRSSLKTGERCVWVLPPLAEFLRRYIPTLTTPWLIPSPDGHRWDKDNFSAALREVNEAAGLPWSAMDYRHTYATQRALEGWPVFDIANQMGNSVKMITDYYAAFIRPSRLPPSSN